MGTDRALSLWCPWAVAKGPKRCLVPDGVVSSGQGGAKAKANQLEYKDLFVDSCTFFYVF